MIRKCFISRPELILLKENFSGRRESQMEAQRCETKDSGQNKYMDACKCVLASPVAQRVQNLPAMQTTWVQSLGWEDPVEKK